MSKEHCRAVTRATRLSRCARGHIGDRIQRTSPQLDMIHLFVARVYSHSAGKEHLVCSAIATCDEWTFVICHS